MGRSPTWSPRTVARFMDNPDVITRFAREVVADLQNLERYQAAQSGRTVSLEDTTTGRTVAIVRIEQGQVAVKAGGLLRGCSVTPTGELVVTYDPGKASQVVFLCTYLGTQQRVNFYPIASSTTSWTLAAYTNADVKVNLATGAHAARVELDRIQE